LPGIIGTMQANEVLKIILGFDNVLSGKLLCYNSRTTETTTLKITRSETEYEKVLANKDNIHNDFEDLSCEALVQEISVESALQLDNVQFIDVRELNEEPQLNLDSCMRIPLGILEQNLDEINSTKNTIIFCQSSSRSKTAVELLQKHNINNCYSLKGGVSVIIQQLKIKI